MRRVGVVTVGRSDYGIYQPVLRRMREDPGIELLLFISGAHLSRELGYTVREIEQDGFETSARIDMLLSSDAPEAVAKCIGLGVVGFAQALAEKRPDILLVLGDRFEMFAAAVASVPLGLPLAHIHGGELTLGAMDDAFRHSITKLAHLHFVSTPEYARRVEQLGEESHRIVVSGAPSLDNLRRSELLGRAEIERRFDVRIPTGFLLVTFHPATREVEPAGAQFDVLLQALEEIGRPLVFTMPNSDPGRTLLRERIRLFCAERAEASWVESFGIQAYFSLMSLSAAMVGNSSSGIIEAASFGLPVVDIGGRQAGRIRPRNVLHAPCTRAAIVGAIAQALDPAFRESLDGMTNPYGTGHAGETIVETLKTVPLDRMLRKKFRDLPTDWARREAAR